MTDLPIGLCRSDHPNHLCAHIDAQRLCSLTLIEELATQGAAKSIAACGVGLAPNDDPLSHLAAALSV
jgi:hypothetical protein